MGWGVVVKGWGWVLSLEGPIGSCLVGLAQRIRDVTTRHIPCEILKSPHHSEEPAQ